MSTITARQPKGIPVGGQFAATTHAEPAADLHVASSVHERTHAGLVGDTWSVHEETQAARDAIHDSLMAGHFGGETGAVRDLAGDDRLLRLAVDRYVVAEHYEPGTTPAADTGHRLGRMLVELQAEVIETALYASEGADD